MDRDHLDQPTARKRFCGDRRGVAAIEFAMLAPFFFALLFALLETSAIFLAEVSLDRAVEIVGRQVRTGSIRSDSLSKNDFHKHLCQNTLSLFDCDKLQIDIRPYASFSDIPSGPPANGNYSSFTYDTGKDQAVVALRVFYDWPLVTDFVRRPMGDKDGNMPMSAMSVFVLEDF